MTAIAGPAGIFQPGSPFASLAASQFESAVPEALGLSLISDPAGFGSLQGQPNSVLGVSADSSSVVFQPIQLSLSNVILLAQAQTGLDLSGFFGALGQNPSSTAVLNRQPPLANPAARAIENSFPTAETVEVQIAGPQQLAQIAGPAFQFLDILQSVSENQAFGTTFSGIASDATLNTVFDTRVGVASGDGFALSDIVLRASDGAPTNFAVRLRGEDGGAPAGQLTQGGSTLGENIVISAADLANVRFESPGNGFGLDTISIIELSDSGGGFDRRGIFQTTTVTFAGQAQSRRDGDERIVDFFFAAQPGTAQTRLLLDVSGLNSGGFTDALSAVNAGVLRIQGFENLADGSRNSAVTSLLESNGNLIVLNFPFSATRNGRTGSNLQVEFRSLDLNFDISTISVRSTFA